MLHYQIVKLAFRLLVEMVMQVCVPLQGHVLTRWLQLLLCVFLIKGDSLGIGLGFLIQQAISSLVCHKVIANVYNS